MDRPKINLVEDEVIPPSEIADWVTRRKPIGPPTQMECDFDGAEFFIKAIFKSEPCFVPFYTLLESERKLNELYASNGGPKRSKHKLN